MSPRLRAFLRVIREGESGQGDDAYQVMFGGAKFDSFADHPRQKHTFGTLTSTAAGAYQFLSRTWDECRDVLGLPDFSPDSQDRAAVFLIKRRGALDDVEAGRITEAINKCGREWASLPGSPYGQPVQTLAGALKVYEKWLDVYTSAERGENSVETVQVYPKEVRTYPEAEQPTSQIERQTPEMQGYQAKEDAAAGDPVEYPQPEQPMPIPAIVGALLPSLIESIPKLGALFGSGSDVQQRNVKAAEMALQVAQTAIGATNAQETVERIKSDPEARQKATQAIEQAWWQLTEAGGGGIDGARKFIAANGDSSGGAVWKIVAVVTYCALGFLALANLVALAVYIVSLFRPESSGQLTAAMQLLGTVIQADIGAALMACGFWLGSSWGSKQKASTS